MGWTEGDGAASPRWQVGASEITVPQPPGATRPDLLLSAQGEEFRYTVDRVPVSNVTKGLINARRSAAARGMAEAIFAAQAI